MTTVRTLTISLICPFVFGIQTILLGLFVGSGKLNMEKIAHVLMTLKTQLVLIYDITLTPFFNQFGPLKYSY